MTSELCCQDLLTTCFSRVAGHCPATSGIRTGHGRRREAYCSPTVGGCRRSPAKTGGQVMYHTLSGMSQASVWEERAHRKDAGAGGLCGAQASHLQFGHVEQTHIVCHCAHQHCHLVLLQAPQRQVSAPAQHETDNLLCCSFPCVLLFWFLGCSSGTSFSASLLSNMRNSGCKVLLAELMAAELRFLPSWVRGARTARPNNTQL